MLLVLSPCLHPPPSCPLLSAGSHTPLSLPPHHHNRHHRCHPTEQMGAPGQSKGPPPAVKKVLSLFGSGREEDKMVGYLSFLKIGPKLLKFLPGGAGGRGMGSCVGVDLGVDGRVCGWVGGWVAPVHIVLRAGQATAEFLSACAWPPGCASAQLYVPAALGPPRRAALPCGCWRRQEGEGPAHLADRLLLLEPGRAGAQGGTLYVQGSGAQLCWPLGLMSTVRGPQWRLQPRLGGLAPARPQQPPTHHGRLSQREPLALHPPLPTHTTPTPALPTHPSPPPRAGLITWCPCSSTWPRRRLGWRRARRRSPGRW